MEAKCFQHQRHLKLFHQQSEAFRINYCDLQAQMGRRQNSNLQMDKYDRDQTITKPTICNLQQLWVASRLLHPTSSQTLMVSPLRPMCPSLQWPSLASKNYQDRACSCKEVALRHLMVRFHNKTTIKVMLAVVVFKGCSSSSRFKTNHRWCR